MTRRYFTDTTTASLDYAGDGNCLVDAEFDPAQADTVTLDSHWTQFFDTDEFVQFDATIAQPIVQPYFHDGDLVQFKKEADELQQAQAQLANAPATVDHPPRDRVTSAEQVRGFWSDPYWEDGQRATLNIPANDPDAVRAAVQRGEVSVGFSGTLDWVDDTTAGFDAVQRNIVYDHVAIVESGRCPPDEGCQIQTDNPSPNSISNHGHSFDDAVKTKLTEDMVTPMFSEGDWVQWDWSGGTAIGRITTVSTDESLMSSAARLDPQEEGEPVYGIDHWDEESGEFGNYKVAKQSDLQSASEPDSFEDSKHTKKYTNADPPVDHLYESADVAREAAAEIGCTGIHRHETDDGIKYMPCATMERFEDLTDCGPLCTPGPCSCGAHDPLMDASVSGEEIDLVPPQAAQDAAQAALDARADEGTEVNGMTAHGWARAEQLASGTELSPSDIVGSSGAMAPWWSRHKSHTIDGDSLAGADTDNPWEDNSYTAGKGWGGMAGYRWAIVTGNEIKRARGEEPTYGDSTHTVVDESTIMDTITYDELARGELDESELPNDDYQSHYVFDAATKSDSAYPLVDADGNLRRGNVQAAWELYGHAEDEQFLLDVLAQTNKKFADADGMSAPIDSDSLDDAMTDSLTDFIDEHDLTTKEVIDALDVDLTALDDVPSEPTAFYDGEPDIEEVADDFPVVQMLLDDKDSLEDEVDTLQTELRETKRPHYEERVDELVSVADDAFGTKDDLMDAFDAENDEERLTIDDIDDKIEKAKQIRGDDVTTADSSEDDDTDEDDITVESTMQVVDEDAVAQTSRGKLDLSSVR
jgi:hypothetical protein